MLWTAWGFCKGDGRPERLELYFLQLKRHPEAETQIVGQTRDFPSSRRPRTEICYSFEWLVHR